MFLIVSYAIAYGWDINNFVTFERFELLKLFF